MSIDTDLRERLEHELADLPSAPPTAYLAHARRVRRRRRVAGAVAVAAVTVAAVQVVSPSTGRESSIADEAVAPDDLARVDLGPDPDFVAPAPNNPVEAVDGLEGVDWFTTDDIPSWAQEYGHHGPVALAPDGRLWVAPDAEVRRVVVDPYVRGRDGVAASYAVEAQCTCVPAEMPDGIAWVILATDGTSAGTGTMDQPGRETDDFELWVDDATAFEQGRPSFAERLVRFESTTSDVLVPASPGVTIVRQDHDTGYDDSFAARGAVAEVTYAGTTWFVIAVDPRDGAAWYDAASADLADSLDSFVESWHS